MITAFFVGTLFLWSVMNSQNNDNILYDIMQPATIAEKNVYNRLTAGSITYPEGEYYPKEKAKAEIILRNPTFSDRYRVILMEILDRNGYVVSSVKDDVIISERTSAEYGITWTIPEDIATGKYYSRITVWEESKSSDQLILLIQETSESGFYIYHEIEEFNTINSEIWGVSEKILGRSQLQRKNVITEEGKLLITLPSDSVNGGEIYTKERKSYGIYEARMKLPNAPSSITGFFFYLAPDYYYEIDIEVLNNSGGSLYLTTYSDGAINREFAGNLGFNPTKGFHNYRIEYQEDNLAFAIDDEQILEWKNGYPKEPMNLYINCWYPNWLDGIAPVQNKYLMVDWIRY